MLDMPIIPSKADFSESIQSYERRNRGTTDIPIIVRTAQALSYVSKGWVERYLAEVRDYTAPWSLAKHTLEGLLQGLDDKNPGIDPTLFSTMAIDLPNEISGLPNAVQTAAVASLSNMSMPFSQTPDFRKLRELLQQFYDNNRASLTKYSEAHAAVEGLKPTANIQSALEILESEAEVVLRKVGDEKGNTFGLLKPANAILYLLEVAKPDEKAGVSKLLECYMQSMIEILSSRIREAVHEAVKRVGA